MSETKRVILEGGNANGCVFDIETTEFDILAVSFVMTFMGDPYRITNEMKGNRQVMVYDG